MNTTAATSSYKTLGVYQAFSLKALNTDRKGILYLSVGEHKTKRFIFVCVCFPFL